MPHPGCDEIDPKPIWSPDLNWLETAFREGPINWGPIMGDQMSGDHMCLGPNVSQPSSTNLLLFSKLITSSVWSIKKKTHRHSEQNLWNSIPWTTQNLGAPDFWHWPLGTMYLRYFRSGTLWVLIKSHVKTVWRPQNLPKDWRSWGIYLCSNLLHKHRSIH